MDQFESFETKRFVQRLLGKGDVGGLMDKIQDVIPEDKQPELLDTISKVRALSHIARCWAAGWRWDKESVLPELGGTVGPHAARPTCLHEPEGPASAEAAAHMLACTRRAT